jgi:hypothetical protein
MSCYIISVHALSLYFVSVEAHTLYGNTNNDGFDSGGFYEYKNGHL